MPTQFDLCFAKLMQVEGLYSNDPSDKGGQTKYGISTPIAREYGITPEQLKELSIEDAKAIYCGKFYSALCLDTINNLDFAYELFEMAVNQGLTQAIKALQTAYSVVANDIAIDGKFGEQTKVAIFYASEFPEQAAIMTKIINVIQGQRYIDICLRSPNQRKFLRGWLTRVYCER